MRLLSLLCGLLLLLGQAEAKVRPYEDMVASGVLRVAVYQNFPPYSFMQDGQPHGIDVDLATRLAVATVEGEVACEATLSFVMPRNQDIAAGRGAGG